jgi:hypothetical protein
VELSEKLAALAERMTDAERANYKFLLSMAAGGLAPRGQEPHTGIEASAFATTLNSISRLQPHRHRIPPDGVVYRGRPEFITDDLLIDLQGESARLRNTAVRFGDHFVVSGAPLASAVGFSTGLHNLIQTYADYVTPTAKANYLYYDAEGLGIDPHVDNEVFALNAVLMLRHVYDSNPSALVLYPSDAARQRIFLRPGEMIVLYADSTIHARERMGRNEQVSIVGFGFQPIL